MLFNFSFQTAWLAVALLFSTTSCSKKNTTAPTAIIADTAATALKSGADRTEIYFHLLAGKKIALVANATSVVANRHLLDTLLAANIEVKKIFAPEHGFRGDGDAGEKLNDSKDPLTGLQIISLHGNKKKPDAADLSGVELVVFDIQDVGVRFFTYLSTLHYVMEACAEQHIPMIVLDRPNPNGHYVAGPILQPKFRSFVGLHPVPMVYGMTIGEYAMMINGEGWLAQKVKCNLQVIDCQGYDLKKIVHLPIRPSPNLQNDRAILLYPSLCLLEGTQMSVGRGTDFPFQVFGHFELQNTDFSFTPTPHAGAKEPLWSGKLCRGFDLRNISEQQLKTEEFQLSYLLRAYQNFPDRKNFFLKNNFFDKLAGTDLLRQQIQSGKSAAEIQAAWQPSLQAFQKIRKKYLRY